MLYYSEFYKVNPLLLNTLTEFLNTVSANNDLYYGLVINNVPDNMCKLVISYLQTFELKAEIFRGKYIRVFFIEEELGLDLGRRLKVFYWDSIENTPSKEIVEI